MNTIEAMIERSRNAQAEIEFITQEQADAAAKAVCKVVFDNCKMLGQLAADDTRMGNIEDKIAKCRNKSTLIWNNLKGKKSVGIIARDEEKGILEIAKPMGVVASVVPSTNPIVTPMSNAAFALKTRNSIIFSPHPRAAECTKTVVALFRNELAALGLPEDLVQGIESPTVEDTQKLMSLADITVATGGMAMVKSAYSSGKPALGVGAGNVQCIVDTDADFDKAAEDIVLGRSFDNGLICLGEQCVFVPQESYTDFIEALRRNGAYYTEDFAESNRLRQAIFPNGGILNRKIAGQSVSRVAEEARITLPENTKMIAVRAAGTGSADDLCREKMCPVVAILPYKTFEEGVDMMVENLNYEGKGHSVCVHSNTMSHVELVGEKCPVSRVIVNQPAGTTGGGALYNGFTPTTTLGCGSWGNNSFSGNLNYTHLMNISRVGFPIKAPAYADVNEVWA